MLRSAAMTTPQTDSLAGGRFQLLDVLGVGGMATVYRAFDRRLQRYRAIKILSPALAERDSLRKRFLAEAQTMATLEESRVVRVFDMGEDEGRVYIVMELVEGGSLVDRVNAAGPLPPQLATQVALQIAESLHVAHVAGVIHRDIKPHNILLTRTGEIRITDFGIAQVQSDASDGLTRTGAVMGTWGFMAPEQRSNAKSVDARADVFSTGATLWALMKAATPPELYAEDDAFTDLPDGLVEVIRKATRYRREERYLSAQALADALREVMTALPADPEFVPPLVLSRGPNTIAPPSDSDTLDPNEGETEVRPSTIVPDHGPDPSLQLRRAPSGDDPTVLATRAPTEPPPAEPPRDARAALKLARPTPDAPPASTPWPWIGAALAALAAFAVVIAIGVTAMGGATTAPPPVAAAPPSPGPAGLPPVASPPVTPLPAADPAAAVDPAAPPSASPAPAASPTPVAAKAPDKGARTHSDPVTTPAVTPVAAAAPDPADVRVTATTLAHTPPTSMAAGGPLALAADGGTGWSIRVYYRPLSGGQYNDKLMAASGTHYTLSLKDPALVDGAEYFLKATTPGGTLTDGGATSPHRVPAR